MGWFALEVIQFVIVMETAYKAVYVRILCYQFDNVEIKFVFILI
jgi:hypothetical protein